MVTRLYPNTMDYSGVAPSAPGATWDSTASFVIRGLGGRHLSQLVASNLQGSGVNPNSHCYMIMRTPPLQAQTLSGTIKGQWRCSESSTTLNAVLAFAITIMKSDGTYRSIALDVTSSDNTAATPPEFAQSASTRTNRRMQDVNENASITIPSTDIFDGDQIVLEVGARYYSTDNSSTAFITSGSDETAPPTDLPEDDTTSTATAVAWVEFSQDLKFKEPFYVRSSGVPVDSAVATNATATITITPPTNMRQGDLVVVKCQSRNANTWTNGVTGGQTWNTLAAVNSGNINLNVFWCVFNGTWGASPRFDSTSSTCTSATMHVFRGRTIDERWELDANRSEINGASNVFQYPNSGNGAGGGSGNPAFGQQGRFYAELLTIATDDDNTFTFTPGSTGSGRARFASDWAQWRNTSGSDQSMGIACSIQPNGVSTPSPTGWTEATLGNDPSILLWYSWFVIDDPLLNMPPMNPPSNQRSAFSGVNVSG